MQKPVADAAGKVRAVIHRDQRMHQVERSDTSRTGHSVTVNDIERPFQEQKGHRLLQCADMLPVNRHATTGHEACPGQKHRPTRNAAQNGSRP